MNIIWVIAVAIMVYLFVHSSSDFRLQMPGTRSFIYIRPVFMEGTCEFRKFRKFHNKRNFEAIDKSLWMSYNNDVPDS